MRISQEGGKNGTPAPPTETTKAVATAPTPIVLKLPEAPSEPMSELGDYTWLLYGEKKIGKTSLASRFPDALFMMFEPGGKALRIYKQDMLDWRMFKEFVKMLQKTDRFKTLVIDTVDLAYEMCFNHICKQAGVSHPTEANDFGKTWRDIGQEFSGEMGKLLKTNRGVVFVSHVGEREFMERGGEAYTKLIPTVPNKGREYLSGVVDIIAYYGYYGKDRMLTIRGSENLDAGSRLRENFLTSDGEKVQSIPMGLDEVEGYDNIVRAFKNQQEDTGEHTGQIGLSEQRPPKKDKVRG